MRTIRFKKKKEYEVEQEEQLQIVDFVVNKEHFGADILRIKEIDLYESYTQVPDVPEFIEGFIIIRSEIVPLIDLRKRFYGKDGEVNLDTRIIVAMVGTTMVGFVVDAVSRVMTIPKKIITKTPRIMSKVDVDYIQGVVPLENEKILLIDFDKVLSKSKKRELLSLLSDEEKQELARLLIEEKQTK